MNTKIETIKSKLNLLPPELLEIISIYIERAEPQSNSGVSSNQIDEVKTRLEFHKTHPKSRLDFSENMIELENLLYR